MNNSGIYGIYSKSKPERFYIGSSVNLKIRKTHHFLKYNKHHSQKLQNHYNKYGKDDLVFEVLEYVEKVNLDAVEQFYIDELKPYFNESLLVSLQGHIPWNKGISPSIETRKKISNTLIENRQKNGWVSPCIGKVCLDTTKEKISRANKGKKRDVIIYPSKETCNKIS
jgi:group I intron endonuclease